MLRPSNNLDRFALFLCFSFIISNHIAIFILYDMQFKKNMLLMLCKEIAYNNWQVAKSMITIIICCNIQLFNLQTIKINGCPQVIDGNWDFSTLVH